MKATVDFHPILDFLGELNLHNEKAWFEAHRPDYEQARDQFENFIDGLIDRLRSSNNLMGLSAKECITRIYRDIRFSRDKSPYHTNFAAIIAPGGKKSTHQGYYVHIQPGDNSMIAGGLYMPNPEQLSWFRQAIDQHAERFKAITGSPLFVETFGEIDGERLKTAPKGYDRSHPEIDLLQLKQVTAAHRFPDRQVLTEGFLEKAVKVCHAMKPFLEYLDEVVGA